MGLARFWLSHLLLLLDRAAMAISTTSEPQRRMTLTHTPRPSLQRSRKGWREGKRRVQERAGVNRLACYSPL